MENKIYWQAFSVAAKAFNFNKLIRYYFTTDSDIKNKVRNNLIYKNKFLGKDCFIFGTGPSLKNVDFSRFSDKYIFTVNHLYKNEQFDKLNTNFHVFADTVFFADSVINDLEMDLREKILDKGAELFIPTYCYSLLKSNDIKEKSNIIAPILKFYPGFKNEIHVEQPIMDFRTVVFQCIQLAIYMGFKNIYLLGCDCTGIQRILGAGGDVHCYDNKGDVKLLSNLHSQNIDVENEFQTWADIFKQYKDMDRYSKKIGVNIYNLTNPTILDCIERRTIDEIIPIA